MPSAIEAEDTIISSVITDPLILDKAKQYISNEVLFKTENKILWAKLQKMQYEGYHIDYVTVISALTQTEKNAGVDAYYVTGLIGLDRDEQTALTYAKTIYEKYLLRTVIDNAGKIKDTAYSNNKDVYGVLSQSHSLIGELIKLRPGNEFNIETAMDEVIESIHQGDSNLIKTGIDGVDELSGGMTRGEISIIGGRPGHGKTTLSVNIIKRLIDSGKRVMIFNREMTNVEMLKKLLVLESQELSYGLVRRGVFDMHSIAEIERIKKLMEEKYNDKTFAMYDNIADFSKAASEITKFKPDVVIDDYIQLIQPSNPQDPRRLQLERIVNDYKWLAKEHQFSAILVSQLNRALESRQHTRPLLSDLAESGTIEQVAENVLFVYYDYKIHFAKSKLGANCIEVIGAKVRYGVSGTTRMGYDGDKVKLYDTMDEYKEAKRR